ncbi:MAG: PKD domain-containing protein [Chitinophagaceae bacterium]|nr:PKD domain-containing protein [Chitinophagaceae bacterium]
MKRNILLTTLFIFSFLLKSSAQCQYTTQQNGNIVTFQHVWAIPLIYALDSIFLDYGDGNTQLKVGSNIGINTIHTYTSPGIYNACITRYLSSISSPGVPIPCTYCSNIVISCGTNAGFNISNTNNVVNLINTSTCPSCVSLTYAWDFGDGSPISTTPNPSHSYATGGTYNICLYADGLDSSSNICTDTFCTTTTVTNPPAQCVADANFNSSSTFLTSSFTNVSTCNNCVSSVYTWNFGDGGTSNTTNPSHTYATAGTYTVCLKLGGTNANAEPCIDSFCKTVVVNSNVGLQEKELAKLTIFPNPASGEFTLLNPANKEMKELIIINIAGKVIQRINLNNMSSKELKVDTHLLSKGIYEIQLNTGDQLYRSKLSIE